MVHAVNLITFVGVVFFIAAAELRAADVAAGDSVVKKPNVVLIVIDDAGFTDLGVYGGEARTPNIDQLANAGVLSTSFHTSPLCAPSRAMLLTGIDNHRTGLATIEEVIPPEHEGDGLRGGEARRPR